MKLYELYQAISSQLETSKVDLVPGILSDDSISKFYQSISVTKSLVIDNPSLDPLTADSSITQFVLTGKTVSLGTADGTALDAKIVFTEQLAALYSVGDFRTDLQWNIAGVEWFGFSKPGFTINAGDGSTPSYGVLGGSPSCLQDLFMGIQLPLKGNSWIFDGKFNTPVGISNVIQLAGGINIVNSIPVPLNTVTSIGVSSSTITYNTASTTLESFSFAVTRVDPTEKFVLFPFLPGFPSVGSIVLNFVVIDPVKTREVTFNFGGKAIFPQSDMDADGARPTISLTGSLPNFTIQGSLDDNGALLSVDDILHIILPPEISTGIPGGFKSLTFSANLVINQLNVEISSGGTYNFEVGAVMTLPFGIGDVSGFLGVYSDGVIPAGYGIKQSNATISTGKFLALQAPSAADSVATAKQEPAYRMMAAYNFMNIDWTLTVDMNNDKSYRYFLSLSEYLTGEYVRDEAKKQTTITIKFGNVSVGDIVALLLSWATPGGPRSLSAPWGSAFRSVSERISMSGSCRPDFR